MDAQLLFVLHLSSHENKHKYEKCASPGAARVEVDVQPVDKTLVCVSLLRKVDAVNSLEKMRTRKRRTGVRKRGRLELPAVG